jgi:hypothetical protein
MESGSSITNTFQKFCITSEFIELHLLIFQNFILAGCHLLLSFTVIFKVLLRQLNKVQIGETRNICERFDNVVERGYVQGQC